MVKVSRSGRSRTQLAPMRKACRKGICERMSACPLSAPSAAVPSDAPLPRGSCAAGAVFSNCPPARGVRSCAAATACRLQEMAAPPLEAERKRRMEAKSSSVSRAQSRTETVSSQKRTLAPQPSPVRVTSETTLPSCSSTMRSAYCSANSRSCETTMTSLSADSFCSVSSTCRPVSLSKAPVGSSARMICGSLTSARAMATRCFCPPERVLGLRLAKPSSSTSRRMRAMRCASRGLFCSSSASATLSSTENSSSTLYS